MAYYIKKEDNGKVTQEYKVFNTLYTAVATGWQVKRNGNTLELYKTEFNRNTYQLKPIMMVVQFGKDVNGKEIYTDRQFMHNMRLIYETYNYTLLNTVEGSEKAYAFYFGNPNRIYKLNEVPSCPKNLKEENLGFTIPADLKPLLLDNSDALEYTRQLLNQRPVLARESAKNIDFNFENLQEILRDGSLNWGTLNVNGKAQDAATTLAESINKQYIANMGLLDITVNTNKNDDNDTIFAR